MHLINLINSRPLAVDKVFPDCPHYIYQFHFLKMICKLLFEEDSSLL